MADKILFVDDEQNILKVYQRNLRKKFSIETALGATAGLEAISSKGPFAVVVSDLRMPGMDGVEFLAKVWEKEPRSVRVMLTGQADMDDAIAVVNEGNIFRFLTKPCPPELMIKTLEASIEQYRLVNAEHELLEKTLLASIKVLTEVLSLVNPTAFGRGSRIKKYVKHMTSKLGLSKPWRFEIAAMLSQLGCVTLPPDTLMKLYARQTLSGEEMKIYASHPSVASKLLSNIPRLESISQIVGKQQIAFTQGSEDASNIAGEIELGGQMLNVALRLDQLIKNGVKLDAALDAMRKEEVYNPDLLEILSSADVIKGSLEVRAINTRELMNGMTLNEDIMSKSGRLLLARGTEVTEAVRVNLMSIDCNVGIVEPFRVLVEV